MNSLKIFFYFLVFLFIIGGVSASSFVTPGKYEFNFYPNDVKEVKFEVGGSENFSYEVNEGLAKTEVIDEEVVSSKKKRITLEVTMPEEIEDPGKTKLMSVTVEEEIPEDSGFGARTRVIAPVYVHVPYPGIYLESSLNVPNINVNETLDIEYKVKNLGTDDLNDADLNLMIKDKGDTLKSFRSEGITIKSREERVFSEKWNSKGTSGGDYQVVAELTYEDEKKKTEKDFKIGNLNIGIMNFTKKLETDSVNKFNILVESKWNNKIEDVNGVLKFKGKSFKTTSEGLEPWKTQSLEGYAELDEIEPGTYDAVVKVNYLSQTTQMNGEINIKENKSIGTTTIMISALVLVLILLVTINILYLTKMKKKK